MTVRAWALKPEQLCGTIHTQGLCYGPNQCPRVVASMHKSVAVGRGEGTTCDEGPAVIEQQVALGGLAGS